MSRDPLTTTPAAPESTLLAERPTRPASLEALTSEGATACAQAQPDRPANPTKSSTTGRPGRASLLRDSYELAKPRITLMVVITAGIGFTLGCQRSELIAGLPLAGEAGGWGLLGMLNALVGVALCCVGAGTLNQVYETDVDALMSRTRHRPLPAGRVSPAYAVVYGLITGMLGLGMLVLGHNLITAALAIGTILAYAFVYTPLKRRTPWATEIGAIPGAMPPVLGYTAASGQLDATAGCLFGILFLWQLPHFYAIGWLYREEYRRAGLPILAVSDPSGRSTFWRSLLGCLLLLPVGAAPFFLGISGYVALFGALALGGWFLWSALRLVREGSTSRARSMFRVSLLYLPLVLMLLVLNRVG